MQDGAGVYAISIGAACVVGHLCDVTKGTGTSPTLPLECWRSPPSETTLLDVACKNIRKVQQSSCDGMLQPTANVFPVGYKLVFGKPGGEAKKLRNEIDSGHISTAEIRFKSFLLLLRSCSFLKRIFLISWTELTRGK